MRAATMTRSASFLGSQSPRGIPFHRRSQSASFSPRSGCAAPALHLEADDVSGVRSPLRRARSEADLFGPSRSNRAALPSPAPATVAEEDAADLGVKWFDLGAVMPARLPTASAEHLGGGTGKGSKIGGGGGGGRGGGGDQNENRSIAAYYQRMIRADPSNPLLLRNYGRFLHEVEGDAKGAEEYYGRAILANPGDGEVLSLYGKLVWDTHREGERAEAYFERAVEASPGDCYVLGSYAQFLWEAEGKEEVARLEESSPTLAEAF